MTWTSPDTIDIAGGGLLALLQYLNNVTLGIFPVMFLLTIYLVGLIITYRTNNDIAGGMAVSGFGVFVISLLFWLGGFLAPVWFGVAIAVMILGVAFVIFDK